MNMVKLQNGQFGVRFAFDFEETLNLNDCVCCGFTLNKHEYAWYVIITRV